MVPCVWFLLAILVLIPKFLIKVIVYSLISIASGLTFYACAYVWNQEESYKKIILLILYPFSLIVGMGMAFTIFFTTLLME